MKLFYSSGLLAISGSGLQSYVAVQTLHFNIFIYTVMHSSAILYMDIYFNAIVFTEVQCTFGVT